MPAQPAALVFGDGAATTIRLGILKAMFGVAEKGGVVVVQPRRSDWGY